MGTVAVSFRFSGGRLTVSNALDENGLAFGRPEPRCRRHSLSDDGDACDGGDDGDGR